MSNRSLFLEVNPSLLLQPICNFTLYSFVEGKKDDHDSGPEEEEVPTRGFLKRQANMIVDAKSRSKRGTGRRR